MGLPRFEAGAIRRVAQVQAVGRRRRALRQQRGHSLRQVDPHPGVRGLRARRIAAEMRSTSAFTARDEEEFRVVGGRFRRPAALKRLRFEPGQELADRGRLVLAADERLGNRPVGDLPAALDAAVDALGADVHREVVGRALVFGELLLGLLVGRKRAFAFSPASGLSRRSLLPLGEG